MSNNYGGRGGRIKKKFLLTRNPVDTFARLTDNDMKHDEDTF